MTADARRLVVPVAIIAAVLLFLLINPWLKIEPGSTLSTIVTVLFWISAIAVIVLMYIDSRDPETPQVEVESPRFAKYEPLQVAPYRATAGAFGFVISASARRATGMPPGTFCANDIARTMRGSVVKLG